MESKSSAFTAPTEIGHTSFLKRKSNCCGECTGILSQLQATVRAERESVLSRGPARSYHVPTKYTDSKTPLFVRPTKQIVASVGSTGAQP